MLIVAGSTACLAAGSDSARSGATRLDHLTLLHPSVPATHRPSRTVGEAVRDKLRLQLRTAHLRSEAESDTERARVQREMKRLDDEIRRLIRPEGS